MSEIADSARVIMIAADFANTDASGKLNLVGGGVTITGLSPQTGMTAPLSLIVISAVEPKFVGQEYALELALYDLDGNLAQQPGPLEPQPIRVAQLVRVDPPSVPQGSYVPPGSVWPTTQVIVNFQNGLPLTAGAGYEWHASIDGSLAGVLGLAVVGPPPTMIG